MNARLSGRHPHHPHKWPQSQRITILVYSRHRPGIERPTQPFTRFGNTEPPVPFIWHTAANSPAPAPRTHILYLHLQRHSWPRTAYRYRTTQGMPIITLFITRLKFALLFLL